MARAVTKRMNRHKVREKSSMAQFASAVSVIDLTAQLRMSPMQMTKAGGVVQNMELEGYSKSEINDVCRAVFVDQDEEYMRKAWTVFAANKESLSIDKFRELFPLICKPITLPLAHYS